MSFSTRSPAALVARLLLARCRASPADLGRASAVLAARRCYAADAVREDEAELIKRGSRQLGLDNVPLKELQGAVMGLGLCVLQNARALPVLLLL
jgi:hypothetical protein